MQHEENLATLNNLVKQLFMLCFPSVIKNELDDLFWLEFTIFHCFIFMLRLRKLLF